MGESVVGRTLNYDGVLGISAATVRLYSKSDGTLVDTDISDVDGRYSIATGTDLVSPWKYFVVGYKSGMDAGITDVEKAYLAVSYFIPLDLVDTNQDILKIDPPDSVRNVVRKCTVSFPTNVVSTGSIEIRNAASGGGSGISITITAGSKFHSNTGDLRANPTYFWIRSATPCDTGGANVIVFYDHPLLLSPY